MSQVESTSVLHNLGTVTSRVSRCFKSNVLYYVRVVHTDTINKRISCDNSAYSSVSVD